MSHLSLVSRPCEVESYLRRVLDSGVTANNNNNSPNRLTDDHVNGVNDNGVEMRSSKKDPLKASRRISKSTHDILAEIFKKIGSKENTREVSFSCVSVPRGKRLTLVLHFAGVERPVRLQGQVSHGGPESLPEEVLAVLPGLH